MRVEISSAVGGGRRQGLGAGGCRHVGLAGDLDVDLAGDLPVGLAGHGAAGELSVGQLSGGVSSPVWASLAGELLAETLTELARAFDGEARYGGGAAAGLAVAAAVLRDRASEALIGHPDPWVDRYRPLSVVTPPLTTGRC